MPAAPPRAARRGPARPHGSGGGEPAAAAPTRRPDSTDAQARPAARPRQAVLAARAAHAPDWRRHLVLVRPETVVRWHRRGWRLFWRWRSRGPIGRPRLSAEVRDLIARMARESP